MRVGTLASAAIRFKPANHPLPRPLNSPHAPGGVLFAIAAQADGHIRHRQHGSQQGAFGRVEGIKLIHVHGAARKKAGIQHLRRQLLAVAGIHGRLASWAS